MYGAHRARDREWVCLDASSRYGGCWIELRYSASFFCFPVRPQLRFLLKTGAEELVTLPAPVSGQGIWRGQVPSGATLWIDPGPGVPHERFRVDEVIELSFATIAARAARTPRSGLIGLVQLMSGRRDGARRKLAEALHDEPLDAYESWRAARRRRPDPLGLDTEPDDLHEAGPLLLTGSDGSLDQWMKTVESLSAQMCPEWRLRLTTDAAAAKTWRAEPGISGEPRVEVVPRGQVPGSNAGALAQLALEPGDCLPVEAVGVLRWFFALHPGEQDLSFDADEPAPSGGRRPVFCLPRASGDACGNAAHDMSELNLAGPGDRRSRHMPRVLLHRAAAKNPDFPKSNPVHSVGPVRPPVDIVIPTRDQAELLQKCLESILDRTRYDNLRILIADNDSREPATRDLFARVGRDPRVFIHSAPGKFNFAAICNAAASQGTGRVVVFLNNDVEAANEDWLDVMVDMALKPDVGAVGAKLIYPAGTMQHAGMVLGLHGAAGHLYRGAAPDEPGYLDRLRASHYVAAVTGACLAIERSKFELAGGFDAETFPVEYNDIDLCLRLAERGYVSAWAPEAVLIHAESATRGRPFLPGHRRKGNERANFLKRWGEAVANDPFFHPAFSLASEQIRLA